MGYIIGGRNQSIVPGTESNFQAAKFAHQNETGITKIPSVIPGRGPGHNKVREAQLRQSLGMDITRTAPVFNDPRYTASTLAIPTDERTLHGLYRFFAETDPIVGSALKIHSELPLADLGLSQCEDSGIQQHYEEMWNDRINGVKLLNDITHEFFEIGNVYPFGAFNETDYMWDQFAILNPDYVKVESTWINVNPLIKLIPDEALKRVVQTQSPMYIYQQLPPEIVRYVMFNQEIPLDPNNVFHLAHAKRPYETKGRALIKRILKILMLEDRFNQANFALATRHAVPLQVVKVGDPKSVEEDHLVYYKQNEQLYISRFDDLWDKFDGIIEQHSNDTETKDVRKHNLFTQAVKEDGTIVWNQIEYIMRHATPEKIIKVKTPVGYVRSTESHGFKWINPQTLEFESVSPLDLQKRSNPTVVTMDYIDYSIDCNIVNGIEITPEIAYLLGLWTADGSFNGQGKHFNISNSDTGILKYLENLETYIPEIEKVTQHPYDGDTSTFIWYSEFKKYLQSIYNFTEDTISFRKSGKECIPNEFLFNSNSNIVGATLAGLIDGDGWLYIHDSNAIGLCSSSIEFLHYISLALLNKRIISRVRPKDGASELFISGKDNLQRLFELILPHLKHSVKTELCIKYSTMLEKGSQNKVYVYDIDQEHYSVLFDNTEKRLPSGEKPLTFILRQPNRVNRKFIKAYGNECRAKKVCESLTSVAVTGIEYVKPTSKNVYDLMLKDDPHVYLVGGEGWLLSSNTGWIPDQTELDAVRDMMANYELDPNFSLIYHYGINVEYYGSNGRMLPVGPELDRIYRLKFIGLGINEQLIAGAGGTYSQAYVSLEVQRQRYLNLQLKLEQFVHDGIFKPVADLCGFYRINQSVSGYGGSSRTSYGSRDEARKDILSQFSSVRDDQDNAEFQQFVERKVTERMAFMQRQLREYVYPYLDFGSYSASNDENLKNYLKWLAKERPWLVDDATLARMGKLDRDDQMKATKADLKRRKTWFQEVSKDGLAPFINASGITGQGGGGGDLGFGGGGGDVDLGPLGGPDEGLPEAPIGAGGPPEAAEGGPAAGETPNSLGAYQNMLNDVRESVQKDDLTISQENQKLLKETKKIVINTVDEKLYDNN